MKCRKNTVRGLLIYLLITAFVALESGSMFQMLYASEINRMNFLILLVLGFCVLAKRKNNAFIIKKNYVNLFIAIIICTSLLDILIWNEIDYFILYCANIASFIICYVLSENMPYPTWRNAFINVIFALAVVSLIGWAIRDKLLAVPFGFDFEGTWQYKSFIVFNMIKAIPIRNCGIFWEPGMYQGFLNFGVLLIIMKRKRTFWDVVKATVLAVTVVTTFSTTGYAILLVLGIYVVYKGMARINTTAASLFLVFAAIMFIALDGFTLLFSWALDSLPALLTDKIVNENASFTTRIYSLLFDVYLGVRYPLGVGRTVVSEMVDNLANMYDISVTARTSTISTAFVYYGILGGLGYLWLWIRGIFYRVNRRLVEFIFVSLVMFMILNNEPMLFHLFFGTIAFYWNQKNSGEGREMSENEV